MKRLRPVNSCLPCRSRRLKCDKEHPACGRCRSTSQQCAYDQSAVVTVHAEESEPARRTSTVPDTIQGPLSQGNEQIQAARELGRFKVGHGGRVSYTGATFWGNAIPAEITDEGDDTQLSGPINAHSIQRLDDKVEPYVGPFRVSPSSRFGISNSAYNHCRLCGRGWRLSCLQAMLPQRQICEKFCLIFFGKIFPLIPILHVSGFRADFDELWRHLELTASCQSRKVAPILRRKPGLLCLIFSMIFSVLQTTTEATLKAVFGGEMPALTANTCYLAVTVCARLTAFPRRPTPYTLAAYIYAQSQFAREEDFRDAPEFVGMSFRLAIAMGLHRQISEMTLEFSELETRRRLWWYIVHLDVMVSCSSGLSPLFIDDKMSNARMISTSGDSLELTKEVEDIRYVVAVKRYETSREIRNILRYHFEDAFDNDLIISAMEARLSSLSENIDRVCQNLLESCYRNSVMDSTYGDPRRSEPNGSFSRVWNLDAIANSDREAMNFAEWAVLLLHLMMHKAFCTLYHPIFSQIGVDDASLALKTRAVKHAQSFLYIFTRLCSQPCSEPFQWMYPGTYQPLQAVSLLVADLLQRPRSDMAETSRGVIDAVFEMYTIDHGVVSGRMPVKRSLSAGGRDAWLMLARARRKALEQIGEDPHLLLPSGHAEAGKCLCGQSIDVEGLGNQNDRMETTTVDTPSQSIPANALQLNATDFEDPFMGSEEFDWHGFETMVGAASGFIS